MNRLISTLSNCTIIAHTLMHSKTVWIQHTIAHQQHHWHVMAMSLDQILQMIQH